MSFLVRNKNLFNKLMALVGPDHDKYPEKDAPVGGILMNTRDELSYHVFDSRGEAEKAVERTVAHHNKKNLGWTDDPENYEILTEDMLEFERQEAKDRRKGKKKSK